MRVNLNRNTIKETDYLIGMIKEEFETRLKEGSDAQIVFDSLQKILEKIYLRPNNVIDTSLYSRRKIESALNQLGFELKKEVEDKLHFYNNETSVSVYLNPTNKKISLIIDTLNVISTVKFNYGLI